MIAMVAACLDGRTQAGVQPGGPVRGLAITQQRMDVAMVSAARQQ